VDHASSALSIPGLDVRLACCDGETPALLWRRFLPAAKALLLAATSHASGTLKNSKGEPLKRGFLTMQGAESRRIPVDDDTGRYLVVLPPGLYMATVSDN
jgi:hypothetical protein